MRKIVFVIQLLSIHFCRVINQQKKFVMKQNVLIQLIAIFSALFFFQLTSALGQQDSVKVIYGKVFQDLNGNCLYDAGEPPIEGWVVQATDQDNGFTATGPSNPDGYYTIYLFSFAPIFEMTVESALSMPLDPVCPEPIVITNPPSLPDTVFVDIPIQFVTADCPQYMVTDIGVDLLRWCEFENTYSIFYGNFGLETAEDAYVDVTFEDGMIITDSDLPYTDLGNNVYQFELGDVDPGQWDFFRIKVKLDCEETEAGQTHCVEAHIYPDEVCGGDPLWSGADLRVEAECTGDSLKFTIINEGAAMDEPSEYIVIEDYVIMMTEQSFQLGIGESVEIGFPTDGSTYRVEVDQVAGHPSLADPSATIEGCVPDGEPFMTGIVTQYAEGDEDPFISRDCRESTASFDPNDKQGFPKGFGDDRLIEANQSLEYLIRFQNTGTDTAFKVVIRDTLSDFLVAQSVKPGAASHAYEFRMIDQKYLEFTFDNIMLPDSNVNEPASHGFVKFRVHQVPENPIGTEIFNRAGIYFDFNEPIITNQTVHRIDEDFIDIMVNTTGTFHEAYTVNAYPNPFQHATILELEGLDINEGTMTIFNSVGQLVKQQAFTGNQIQLQRGNLSKGVYFFTIEVEKGRSFGKGTLIVE